MQEYSSDESSEKISTDDLPLHLDNDKVEEVFSKN